MADGQTFCLVGAYLRRQRSRLGHRASPQRKQGEPTQHSMPCRERGKRNPCSTTYQTVFEPERLVPTAQGEVGEALGTVSAHDSALKGAVQTTSLAKPYRKQVNGPFRADEHSNTIPKALPWADGIGPTGRKTGIWKRKCSKRPVSI